MSCAARASALGFRAPEPRSRAAGRRTRATCVHRRSSTSSRDCDVAALSSTKKGGPRAALSKRYGDCRLLRRDAHLGCSSAHVGVDLLLVLDEVLLEHA